MKTIHFRPALEAARLEDRLVLSARLNPGALYASAFLAPPKPVVSVAQVSQAGVAINTNYVGPGARSALNQANVLNAANAPVATPGTGTETLAQAQAYLTSLITLFGTTLPKGTQLALATLPSSAPIAADIIGSTNTLITVPLQNALTTLNNLATPTQTDIDTAINAGNAATTATQIEAAATQANTFLKTYNSTVTVIPAIPNFRQFHWRVKV